MKKTSRRTLLKNSAAPAAALSLDWRFAQAQAETVRIGVIFDHSGPFAAGGSVACAVGTQIAIDLCNEKGGVGGKYKIETVKADSQSKADVAINETERLMSQEKVDIINGVKLARQRQSVDIRSRLAYGGNEPVQSFAVDCG